MENTSPAVPFPLLQTPIESEYRCCTIPYRFSSDNPRKATPVELQWIEVFLNSVPSFRSMHLQRIVQFFIVWLILLLLDAFLHDQFSDSAPRATPRFLMLLPRQRSLHRGDFQNCEIILTYLDAVLDLLLPNTTNDFINS